MTTNPSPFTYRSEPKPTVILRPPPPLALRLSRKAWPGPLTLICDSPRPEAEKIAQLVPAEQLGEIYHNGKVGLRCPAHGAATELLSAAKVPVVASSANRTGKKPPHTVREALRNLEGKVEFAFDGGRTRYNAPSTIVEICSNRLKIRRKGAIAEVIIRRMAKTEIVMVCTGNSCRSPLAEYLYRTELAKRLGVPVAELDRHGYVISSAGTIGFGGGRISAGSLHELDKRGIDASEHRTRPLTVELIRRSERIYAMSAEHKAAVLELLPEAADRVFMLDDKGPVADPIGGGPLEYQGCAAHIERAVNARLEELLHEDCNW